MSTPNVGLNTLALVSLFALGCSDGSADATSSAPIVTKIPDEGDVQTRWLATQDPSLRDLAEQLQDSGVAQDIANDLNGAFRFPNDLMLTHSDCEEANAYYDPEVPGVLICYQFVEEVRRTVYDPSNDDELMEAMVEGTWMFTIYHEFGHALINQYELPITGREEDAADEFATLTLIEAGWIVPALSAAIFWYKFDDEKYTTIEFADEHSFDRQRFYAILCTVYGSNPAAYSQLVEQGTLPESEAERCQVEYEQKVTAWHTLLEPYLQ